MSGHAPRRGSNRMSVWSHASDPPMSIVKSIHHECKEPDVDVRLVSIVIVLGGWEIVGRQVNPLFMSSPRRS